MQNYPQPYHQDAEIDLLELAEKLWDRKILIISITFLITVISLVVAFTLPRIWKSETRIYQSSPGKLSAYNTIASQLSKATQPTSSRGQGQGQGQEQGQFFFLSGQSAFNAFHRNLSSRSTLRTVFQKSGLQELAIKNATKKDKDIAILPATATATATATVFDQFVQSVEITLSDNRTNNINSLTVAFSAVDKHFSAALINDFLLPIAIEKTRKELSDDISGELQAELTKLDQSIFSSEQVFIEQNRLDIQEFSQALSLAKAGGVSSRESFSTGAISGSKLFLLGAEILETMLQNKKSELANYRFISKPVPDDSDKPLIPEVSQLYLTHQALEKTDTSLKNLLPVIVDEPATVPVAPIKPKKKLIVSLGVVLGGMLGVFVALVLIAINSRRERLLSSQDPY